MTDSPAQSVLVVVPALNEAATIEGVLRSLAMDLPRDTAVRVVVADGGSTDETVQIVRRVAQADPSIVLMRNPRRIQSAGVNLATARYGAHADVLVRCDAHAKYPRGFVSRLLATLAREQADAVVVPMDSEGASCFHRAVAWVSNTWAGTGGSAHRAGRRSGFVDHGHHAAFRMESFRRAGGYDETFTHNEDAELDCRQRALGSRIYLDAEIRLGYKPRASVGALWRQYMAYGSGRARTVLKHPGSVRLRQLAVPTHVVACMLALALAPWWPLLLLWPAFYVAALAGLSVMLALRHRSLCGLLAGVAAATMHLAWATGYLRTLLTVRERRWTADSATGAWQRVAR
jgi:succinoglycan biosynthesis protein ExoA